MATQILLERAFPMSRTSGYRLSVMIFAMVVGLTMPACRTSLQKGCDAETVSISSDKIQDVIRELKAIIIPEMTFYSPATIVDAVNLFKKASRDYAQTGKSQEKLTLRFELNLPFESTNVAAPRIAALSVRAISLYDAIFLVCQTTDMRFLLSEDGRGTFEPRYFSEGEPLTRSYTVPQALEAYLFSSSNGQAPNAEPDKVWKAFFEQLGVSGPKWAEFSHLPAIGKLRVTSTAENLSLIEAIFERFSLYMIEVEMQIHAFRTADIESLRLTGGMSLESLMALRQKGKGKPVATSTVLTKSGQEAIVKAVREVIYPTELLTNIQSGSNMTVQGAAPALVPCLFSMRETGMILQVLPEAEQNGLFIHLYMKPQWISLDRWEPYPADLAVGWTHTTRSFKQPVFGVTSFDTVVAVKDGETVLIGSCSTPDGEWVQVGFLTARFVDKKVLSEAEAIQQAAQEDEKVKKKMKNIVIPEVTFRPPATIIDAFRFFKEASVDYDDPELPETQRGVNFALNLSANSGRWIEHGARADLFAASAIGTNSIPVIPAISARFINLYDALRLVCDVTGMKFRISKSVVRIMPESEPCDSLILRTYPLPITLFERLSGDTGGCTTNSYSSDLRTFFAQMGVNWPMGSSAISHEFASIRFLRVINTPENLKALEQVLEDFSVYPRMVEVDVQIHAFRFEDIEQVRLSGKVSVEALMDLRRKGKTKPVASATVLTKSGVEATVKAVQEVIYPEKIDLMGASWALGPENFETREMGMILQVTPEFVQSGTQIYVGLIPKWVTLDGWKFFPAERAVGWSHKRIPFKQPIFGVTSFETKTVVQAGKTVLLGSSSTPDGKWVHVGFLTVK